MNDETSGISFFNAYPDKSTSGTCSIVMYPASFSSSDTFAGTSRVIPEIFASTSPLV